VWGWDWDKPKPKPIDQERFNEQATRVLIVAWWVVLVWAIVSWIN
jgi:hypothetical protein